MSIAALNWAYSLGGISASQKFVLVTLSNYADEENRCYPGIERIARDCCMGKRTVIRAIGDLEKLGLLTIERRGGFGEGRAPNRYKLELSAKLAHRGQSANAAQQSANLATEPSINQETTNVVSPRGKKPSKKKTPKYTENDLRLARWIFTKLQAINPGHREPSFESWADTIRLTRDRDKRTHREIAELFAWANQNQFWKTNILCPATLRKQWDKLEIARRTENENRQPRKTTWAEQFYETCESVAREAGGHGGDLRQDAGDLRAQDDQCFFLPEDIKHSH